MIDKSKLYDSRGYPITQSLFLEFGYTPSMAVYTLKENDYEYEGVLYPSIKKLYLELADPTEYEFANTYFLNWKHWTRITENKAIRAYIDEWREELEYKLRSNATRQMIDAAKGGNYQAIKWLTDRGWNTKAPGRPSKEQKIHEEGIQSRIQNEYSADVHRLFKQ